MDVTKLRTAVLRMATKCNPEIKKPPLKDIVYPTANFSLLLFVEVSTKFEPFAFLSRFHDVSEQHRQGQLVAGMYSL